MRWYNKFLHRLLNLLCILKPYHVHVPMGPFLGENGKFYKICSDCAERLDAPWNHDNPTLFIGMGHYQTQKGKRKRKQLTANLILTKQDRKEFKVK